MLNENVHKLALWPFAPRKSHFGMQDWGGGAETARRIGSAFFSLAHINSLLPITHSPDGFSCETGMLGFYLIITSS